GCGADAVVLDLEDSVAPDNRSRAQEKLRAFLELRPKNARKLQLWVRINALDDSALQDLSAVAGGAPDGIVLPKIQGPEDIQRLGYMLDALEVREGVPLGQTKICAVATETPAAVLRLPEFAHVSLPRLVPLSWAAEDVSAPIGASASRDSSAQWAWTRGWARSAVLLAANAAGVQAIETLYVDYGAT